MVYHTNNLVTKKSDNLEPKLLAVKIFNKKDDKAGYPAKKGGKQNRDLWSVWGLIFTCNCHISHG